MSEGFGLLGMMIDFKEANDNFVGGGTMFPLNYAAMHGNKEVVQKLLEKGNNKTIKNK